MDRDFERHLQNLFDAKPDMADTEAFVALVEGDLRRMRQVLAASAGLAIVLMGVGVYFAVDPLWSQWADQALAGVDRALTWTGGAMIQVTGARTVTPYANLAVLIGMTLVASLAATVGLVSGRRT